LDPNISDFHLSVKHRVAGECGTLHAAVTTDDTVNAYRALAASPSLRYLSLGRMLRSFNQAYLGVVTPIYLLARGATPAQVGILVTVWASGSALMGLCAGFLGDRFGRKLVLAAFSILSAAAALAFYFDMPIWLLGIAGALGGIGRGGGPASGGQFGPFYSAEQALVAEHADNELRTRVFAAFSMVGAIGGAFGFLLTYEHRYRIVYLIACAISVLLLASIVPIRESAQHATRLRQRVHVALTGRTREFVARLMITNATNGLAVGFMGPMLVLWFHLRYNAPAQQIGTIYMIIGFSTIASYSLVGRAVHAAGGAVRAIVGLRVLSCGLLAILPLMPTVWLAGAIFLVRVLVNSMSVPVRQSYVMGIVAPHERARVASISNLPSQFASMAGPSIAGVMLHSMWIGAMLEAAAVLQLLNAGLYWTFFRRMRPPEER
jgi:MFS family permease